MFINGGEEKREQDAHFSLSFWPYPGWQSHKFKKKWGHLDSSSQRKAELNHCFSCLHLSRASKVFSPHKSAASYPPLTQQLLHLSDGKLIILESPEALQIWGLLIHIPHCWGEANQPHVAGPRKVTPRCKAEGFTHIKLQEGLLDRQVVTT